MNLLPPKRPPRRQERGHQLAFRPDPEQLAYIHSLGQLGWSISETLREFVNFHRRLDHELASHMRELHEFARAEGLLTNLEDMSWQPLAIARLAKLGLESLRNRKRQK
jgi:hypothetical protein